MAKKTARILVVLFIIFATYTTSVSAAEYFVSTNGSNSNPGSIDSPWQSIDFAVSNLSAGDTLNIRQGTFEVDSISVNFSGPQTIIQGYDQEAPILHKTRIRNPIFNISKSAVNVTFKNLDLRGEKFYILSGWESYSGNVWMRPTGYNDQPTEIRFDQNWSTNNGRAVVSLAEVNSPLEWYYDRDTSAIYVYSEGDPDLVYNNPGINQIDDYDATGIQGGNASSIVTIDNVMFTRFSHGGVKGSARWLIKNSYFEDIGTDSHDHHIYSTGRHSEGSEVVIEYNYFGYAAGYALHLYSDPSFHIVRYNIIHPKNSLQKAYGILLSGDNHKIYGNTIYDANWGLMFFRAQSHDNEVKNNIFYGNNVDITVDTAGGSNSFPYNLTSSNNYLGSLRTCSGCTNRSAQGGPDYSTLDDPPNIIDQTNPFILVNPVNWMDFRINGDFLGIDVAENLGSTHANTLDSQQTSWPPNSVDQNNFGTGWEIGAFVYRGTIPTSTPTPVSTTTSTPTPLPGDINADNVVNILDYTLLSNAFGTSDPVSDINSDGTVNILDYTILSNNFGKTG